jgi:hypothetical protein
MLRDDYYLPNKVLLTINDGEITTIVAIKCNSVVGHPIFDEKSATIHFVVLGISKPRGIAISLFLKPF